MKGHEFNLLGGKYLTQLGASWFVSFYYFLEKDRNHLNWQIIKTHQSRISIFNKAKKYHQYWLMEVLRMNDLKLNTNKILLDVKQVKVMAEELFDKQKTDEQMAQLIKEFEQI